MTLGGENSGKKREKSENTDIYIIFHNSSKIAIMK